MEQGTSTCRIQVPAAGGTGDSPRELTFRVSSSPPLGVGNGTPADGDGDEDSFVLEPPPLLLLPPPPASVERRRNIVPLD